MKKGRIWWKIRKFADCKKKIVMVTRKDYERLKAFARIDGALLGALWVLSFACFIGEFYDPLLGVAAMLVGVWSLVFAALRLRRYRDNVLGGYMSFRRGYAYSMFVYFYATLIMAAGQFIYFQFLDHGFLASKYQEMISMPEFGTMLQLYGMKDSDMKLIMQNMSALRPIDNALQYLTFNIILGVVMSLPAALIMKREPLRKP